MLSKTNREWRTLLSNIMTYGTNVSPSNSHTYELVANKTQIDMNYPVVASIERKMGYRFMAGEAWWILSGSNLVSEISPYSKAISHFSDDGHVFAGAYGPEILDQIEYVVDRLVEDIETRQATMTIWKRNPGLSKDIPCTLSAQFLIREGKLVCVDTMRSSDAWLGWVYDIFNFSCLSTLIALKLRERGLSVELGQLHLTAGSQHLYERNFEQARLCIENHRVFVVNPIDLDKFDNPDEFIGYLKVIADIGKFDTDLTSSCIPEDIHWLRELPHVQEWINNYTTKHLVFKE